VFLEDEKLAKAPDPTPMSTEYLFTIGTDMSSVSSRLESHKPSILRRKRYPLQSPKFSPPPIPYSYSKHVIQPFEESTVKSLTTLVKQSHELLLDQGDGMKSMTLRIGNNVINVLKYYEAVVFIESETALDLKGGFEHVERLHTWIRFINSKL
jgi:hypothetical protein